MIDAGTNDIIEEPFLRVRQRYGAFLAIHRHSAILVTTLVLVACGSAPARAVTLIGRPRQWTPSYNS